MAPLIANENYYQKRVDKGARVDIFILKIVINNFIPRPWRRRDIGRVK